jgi:hypothetical protein
VRLVVIAALACGCGRIFVDPLGANGDGGSIGGDGIGGMPGDVAPANACPTTIAFSDDFTSTTPLAMWTVQDSSTDASVSQGAGALTIAFVPNAQNGAYAGLQLAATMSFSESCATVRLDMAPNQSANDATATFGIGPSVGSVNIRMEIGAGTLLSECEEGGNRRMRLDTRTYDPVAHRYLRIRNSGASGWFWEVSPDGTTFTTLANNPCTSVAPANVLALTGYLNPMTTNAGSCVFGPVTVYR